MKWLQQSVLPPPHPSPSFVLHMPAAHANDVRARPSGDTARDSMRDALVTLTRFSTELSSAFDDERRSGDRRRYADIARLPRAHLPVFAKSTEPRIERSTSHGFLARKARPRKNDTGEGRRRRREVYRNDVRRATRAAADEVCVFTGRPVVSQYDIDDNVIADDDLCWEVPALATKYEKSEDHERDKEKEHRDRERDRERAQRKWKNRMRDGAWEDTAASGLREPDDATGRASVSARRDVRAYGVPPKYMPFSSQVLSNVNAGDSEVSEWDSALLDTNDLDSFLMSTSSTNKNSSGSSHFVPTADPRFVKQQSYCKTGHVPGFRRTRFLRLVGSELQCYSRDLNRQLWITDVQHSFIKISNSQRRVVVFCVAARKAISFYLASADMCASWARALSTASVSTFPRKMSSQKTAKEMAREGMYLSPL